ncbi:MAG: PhoH family protein [Lachnospirales bacterium]
MEENNAITIDARLLPKIVGSFDENLKAIEEDLKVQIIARGENISINGDDEQLRKAYKIIDKMIKRAERNEEVSVTYVKYLISIIEEIDEKEVDKMDSEVVALTISNKPIRPKTVGQKRYVEAIKKNTVVFGVGPAGTGKTYLAMAMAIKAFKNNQVNRIILTRPAIEAGERLGFLPGDLQQKVDPYLRPLYDALYEIMGAENFTKNMEKGLIEVAPLAYMRGRTLDNAFIVLDEAQNTTPEQMKMFLTRIGFGSKVCVTGDVTQIDLPYGKKSGLDVAVSILENVEDISICKFTNKDVVRHPLVQSIIKAYEKADKEQDKRRKREEFKEERSSRFANTNLKKIYVHRDANGKPIRNRDKR